MTTQQEYLASKIEVQGTLVDVARKAFEKVSNKANNEVLQKASERLLKLRTIAIYAS